MATTARVLFGAAVGWSGRCGATLAPADSAPALLNGRGDVLSLTSTGVRGCYEDLRRRTGIAPWGQAVESWWPADNHAAMWGHLLKSSQEAEAGGTLAHAAGAVAVYGAAIRQRGYNELIREGYRR